MKLVLSVFVLSAIAVLACPPGPDGPAGATGPAGPTGATGPAGPQGGNVANAAIAMFTSTGAQASVAGGVPFFIGTGATGTTILNTQPTVIGAFTAVINSQSGSIFNITKAGTYQFDYEATWAGAHSFALFWRLVSAGLPGGTTVFTEYAGSVAGSATATTWVHGRYIDKITVPTYYYISPVLTDTISLSALPVVATNMIRLTIVQLQ